MAAKRKPRKKAGKRTVGVDAVDLHATTSTSIAIDDSAQKAFADENAALQQIMHEMAGELATLRFRLALKKIESQPAAVWSYTPEKAKP